MVTPAQMLCRGFDAGLPIFRQCFFVGSSAAALRVRAATFSYRSITVGKVSHLLLVNPPGCKGEGGLFLCSGTRAGDLPCSFMTTRPLPAATL